MLETIFIYCGLMVSNKYVLGGVIYVLGMLIQSLITTRFIKGRKQILVEYYGHTNKSLKKLYFMSILLWPISFFYAIKSLFTKNEIEDYEEDREEDE